MSPNINSFVGDLVAMAQAMDELPKVQAALTSSEAECNQLSQTVQDRELSILTYKARIETLHERVRSLEVERDDAGFRVLELEDRMSTALRSFRLISDEVASAVLLIDPPMPEPIAETVEAQTTDPHDLPNYGYINEPSPTAQDVSINSGPSADFASASMNADASIPAAEPGPDTTTHRSLTEADLVPEPKGKYHGKNYWDIPQYIHQDDWANGGGDLNNYLFGKKTPRKLADDDMPF